MIITRFNPSTNGNLHLGHIMTALINEYFAHSVDGKFYVRFDDNSPHILDMPSKRVKKIMDKQRKIIEWLDISVDGWSVQSEFHNDVTRILDELGWKCIKDEKYPKLPIMIRYLGTGWLPYPFVEQQIAERVVMDYILGITHLIRGEDFVFEYSYYLHLCDRFRFPRPDFFYLPRLTGKNGLDISKTNGGHTISNMRDSGYTANDIKWILAKSCLLVPGNGWDIYNLKREPRLEI